MSTVASAYVKAGRLCIMGLHESEIGPVPFAYSVEVDKETPEGKVDIGDEKTDQKIKTAIDASQEEVGKVIEREKMRLGAEQLVERARVGDQNAMAMIFRIRLSAKAGGEKARQAFGLLKEYIQRHPTDESGGSNHYYPSQGVVKQLGAHVGEDLAVSTYTPGIPDLYVAALVLANGPTLGRDRIDSIGSDFGEDYDAFRTGVQYWRREIPRNIGPDVRRAAFTGQAVGLARTIQGVRAGKFPISRLSPMAGWELGE